MRTLILVSLLSWLATGCGLPQPISVTYGNYQFDLPMNVKTAQATLKLDFEVYHGFYQGDLLNPDVTVQLEGQPEFFGRDNWDEEHYYNEQVIGVGFRNLDQPFVQLQQALEAQYQKKLVVNRQNLDEVWGYFETDTDLLIVLKTGWKGTIINFYHGISARKLAEYVKYVH